MELQKHKKALKVLQIAARLGNMDAQVDLYKIYAKYLAEDTEEGMKYLQKAAEQGHPEAQAVLGECYRSGRI